MEIEQIEERVKNIKNEIHLLECNKENVDKKKINSLLTEKQQLTDLLESYFDNLIGL